MTERQEEAYLVKLPSRILVREDDSGNVQFLHVPEHWVAYAEMYGRITGVKLSFSAKDAAP